MSDFEPVNTLENALLEAKAGAMPMKVFAGMLLGSELFIPSASEIKADLSGFQPLLFHKDDQPMLAAFTDSSRLMPFRGIASFFVKMNGLTAFKRIPKGYGMLINARTSGALEITSEGIAQMLADLS